MPSGVPTILFTRGRAGSLASITAAGADCVAIDWTVDLADARRRYGASVAFQGNLDPLALLAGGDALDRAVDEVLAQFGAGPLIFNLGHGILPQTPIAHVEQTLRRLSRR